MKRSTLLMIISVIVFLLSLIYAWVETPRLKKSPLPVKVKKTRAVKSSGQLSEVTTDGRLRVDLLTRETAAFSGVKRDLFTGSVIRATPPPAPVKPPKPKIIAPLPEPKPVPEQVAVAPIAEVVRTQLAQFTFLGYLKKGHQQSVFLVESGEIFVVKQGDRFGNEDQFEVHSIAVDKMTISDINSGSTISVSLVEQAPLTPDEVFRRRTPVTPSSAIKKQDMPDVYRNDSSIDDTEPVMPPHMLPPMPPGTKVPPSWHNSPRGIPHE